MYTLTVPNQLPYMWPAKRVRPLLYYITFCMEFDHFAQFGLQIGKLNYQTNHVISYRASESPHRRANQI